MRVSNIDKIKLAGRYCLCENEFKYNIYVAGENGYIFSRNITHDYNLQFVSYTIDTTMRTFNVHVLPELRENFIEFEPHPS